MTFLCSDAEHFTSFFLTGILSYLAYPRRLAVSLLAGIAFAAGVELLQIPLPGRHARLSDFIIDASAACIGTVFGFLLVRIRFMSSLGQKGRSRETSDSP